MTMAEGVVDHYARREVAVLKEAMKGTNDKLGELRDGMGDLRSELRGSSDKVMWTVLIAAAVEVVSRLWKGG